MLFSKKYYRGLWNKSFYSTEDQSKFEHEGQVVWEQPKQRVCVPEQELDLSAIVKNIFCCCYEHAGSCQVTASIFDLCASQISLKLAGFYAR